ncbi:MAG: stage III sporulation protein AF [Bariatricus sp.]|nr:stage III sporulation protein AF [Bariatricus sp.]
MFSYLYEWMSNLAFYMILVTAILQVIPDKSYEKYIRFFCGLILVVLLMTPVMKILDAGFTGRIQSAVRIFDSKEMEDLQEEARRMEEFASTFAGGEEDEKERE